MWEELIQLADVLLIVTTAESECLRMAYARCKTIGAGRSQGPNLVGRQSGAATLRPRRHRAIQAATGG